jgi:hypothetical protein
MLLCGKSPLKQNTSLIHLHVLLYNATKQMFMCQRFAVFVIKQKYVILIFIYCFVTLFNKNILSTALYFPVILEGQFSSYLILSIL